MLLLFLPRIRTLCRNLKFNYCTASNTPANVEMEKTKTNKNIVWIDMEMSGLNEEKDKILEVACVVTDNDLNIISAEIDLVIHQPDEVLNGMDNWCTRQHKTSGLIKASRESKTTIEEAESQILKMIEQYTQPKTSPLAGNSVYMDRFFLKKNMPTLEDYLHYRIIDVSTVKELAKRWNPKVYDSANKKTYSHRALDDIKESIQELQTYKNNFLTLK